MMPAAKMAEYEYSLFPAQKLAYSKNFEERSCCDSPCGMLALGRRVRTKHVMEGCDEREEGYAKEGPVKRARPTVQRPKPLGRRPETTRLD